MKTSFKQNGISLIEVLIVMVLLLIGIFSVIRIFPPGFLINKQTEAATAATRLSNNEVQRFTATADNLMDGILPVQWNGTGFVISFDTTPDDLGEVASTNLWGYYWSDSNKVRRVFGERVRIPVPSPTNAGQGSLYMLSLGPFMDVPWDAGRQLLPGEQQSSLYVYGGALTRIIGDSTSQDPPNLGNQQYAIDYENGKIAFAPAGYDRSFLVAYSYYDASQRAQTAVDQIVTVPADTAPDAMANWIAIPGLQSGWDLVPYSEMVARKFKQLQPSNGSFAWTGDPYEFGVLSQRIPANGAVGANVGVLLFNPAGHNYVESTSSGRQPLTARIDYDVFDWHIIHEDRPMPGSPPYRVPLALKFIKQMPSQANNNQGDFENDQTPYQGIFYGTGATPPDQADMMVYDISTGQRIDPSNYTVDYRDGSVTFIDSFGNQNTSASFRFYYKARGDWSLQVQKAFSVYRQRGDANLAMSQGKLEYYIGSPTAIGGKTVLPVYFPLTEAGKAVSISDLRYAVGSGQGATYAHATNDIYQVNADRSKFQTFGSGASARTLTFVDIRQNHSDATDFDYTQTGAAVTGVTGLSFRARVLWNNGGTVTATPNGNLFQTHWRKIDVDTVLTRTAQ